MLQQPFYQAIYPKLSRARAVGHLGDAWVLIRHMSHLAAAVVPTAVLISIGSIWLIPALGGGFDDEVEVVPPLAAATAVAGILFWLHAAALATDLQASSLRALAISAAIQLAALLALVPVLGALGAGIAYVRFVGAWAVLLLPPVKARMLELASRVPSAASL